MRGCIITHDSVHRTGNALSQIKEVTLRRARLVLGWVTVHGMNYEAKPIRSTQPR